jgi:hypothetical protein
MILRPELFLLVQKWQVVLAVVVDQVLVVVLVVLQSTLQTH